MADQIVLRKEELWDLLPVPTDTWRRFLTESPARDLEIVTLLQVRKLVEYLEAEVVMFKDGQLLACGPNASAKWQQLHNLVDRKGSDEG